MSNKNYANLIRRIFAENSVLLDEEAINKNEELSEVFFGILDELWENDDLERVAIDEIVAESKTKEDFSEYIKANADKLAVYYMEKSLRKLRHPEFSSQLKPFIAYKENKQ